MSEPGGAADRLEILTEAECADLLRAHDLGRLGLVEADVRPLVLPLNYFFEDGIVAFRTSPGSKLDLVPGSYVCFEIDGWDPVLRVGWSVVARGIARDITEPRGSPAGRIQYWPVQPLAPGVRRHWIGVWVSEMTGRRFNLLKAG